MSPSFSAGCMGVSFNLRTLNNATPLTQTFQFTSVASLSVTVSVAVSISVSLTPFLGQANYLIFLYIYWATSQSICIRIIYYCCLCKIIISFA